MSYGDVWLIVVAAGVLSAGGWFMLIRTFAPVYVQVLVPAVWLAALLVPAPVPGYSGNFAPAFVVLLFEGLFQAEGDPGLALRFLLAGVFVAVAGVSLTFVLLRRRRQPSP